MGKIRKVWNFLFGKESHTSLKNFTEKDLEVLEKLLKYHGMDNFCSLDKKQKRITVFQTKDNYHLVKSLWLILGAARRGTFEKVEKVVQEAIKEQEQNDSQE